MDGEQLLDETVSPLVLILVLNFSQSQEPNAFVETMEFHYPKT